MLKQSVVSAILKKKNRYAAKTSAVNACTENYKKYGKYNYEDDNVIF